MRHLWFGLALWHKQCPDEEWVFWVLDDSNLTFAIRAEYAKRSSLQNIHLAWIDAKIAVVSLGCGQAAVDGCDTGVRLKLQLHLSTRQ
jgi:hypothetical protein